MSWVTVVLGLLLLIGAALFVGWAFHRSEGKLETRLLKTRLKALGIEPSVFSEECLTELIERGCGTKVCQVVGRTAAIEGVAINVAWVFFGKKGYTEAEIKAEIDRGYPHGHVTFFWKVLANHHPERFALEKLDETQSVNKLLEAEKSLRT
jgi:hypothetical protein